jgi:O-antigen/teichoic acid export membrane protein
MTVEKPTAEVAKRIVKNSVALIMAHITISFGSFLLVIAVSRYLDLGGFGIYSTILTFYATLEVFASLGFVNYIPREVGRAPERSSEYLSHSIISAVGSVAFLLALAHFIAPLLGYNSTTVAGIRIAILALAPAAFISISQSFLIAYEKAEYITFLNFMEIAARILSSIYLLHLGHGVLSIIAAYCFFRYVSFFCYAFVVLRQVGRPRWTFDYGFFKHFIKDLAVFSALVVAGGLFNTIETFTLSLFKGETAVGIYNAGYRLVFIWSIIPGSIMNAALPNLSRLYRHSRAQFDALAEKSIKYLALIAFPLIIGTTVVADDIVAALYGESFGETAIVLRLLIWSMLPMFWDDALWRILLASDDEAFTLRVTVINLLIMAGLCLLLIPPLGYVGASLVVILVLTLQAGSYAVYVQMHVTKIRYRKVIAGPLLASLVMGLLAAALRSYLPLAAVISISVPVYIAAAFLLGAVSPQELISLWKQVRLKTSYEADVLEPEV